MIRNYKFGFSLAEVLVTMGLLGVLTSMLIPVLHSVQPNQNKILLRKGYQVVERTVNLMINDDALYPDDDAFANSTYGGGQKFCQNFQDALNMVSYGTCPTSGGPAYIGSTPDGIDWYYTAGTFTQSGNAFNNIVAFDVNGSAKTPNCATTSMGLPSGYTQCGTGKKADLFKVGIRWDGKIHMGGASNDSDSYAQSILSSVSNNLNDD